MIVQWVTSTIVVVQIKNIMLMYWLIYNNDQGYQTQSAYKTTSRISYLTATFRITVSFKLTSVYELYCHSVINYVLAPDITGAILIQTKSFNPASTNQDFLQSMSSNMYELTQLRTKDTEKSGIWNLNLFSALEDVILKDKQIHQESSLAPLHVDHFYSPL